MKLLIVFLTALFNQDSFLVKQGDVEVPLGDLDAYVYLLQSDKRNGFAIQKQQIEKNILTLLNINIVYQHVLNTELNDLDIFKDVIAKVKAPDMESEDVFFDALDVKKDQMIESVKMYNIKTEYYKTMLTYLKDSFTDEVLENLALEYYMINKKKFITYESRDLSVITISSDDEVKQNLDLTISELVSATQDSFHEVALKISSDPSKTSNLGHWGSFKKSNFNYKFSDKVFNASVGVIQDVLEDKGIKYIIRVNEIFPEEQGSFDQVKSKIIKQLKDKAVERKFQSIINQKANQKAEVNAELVAHIFERYKVFTEE